MGDADRNDRCQAFTKVVALGRYFFEQLFFLPVVIQGTCQRGTKTRNMRPAFLGVDIVHVGMHVLGKLPCVLESNLKQRLIDFPGKLHHLRMQCVAGSVEIFNKLHNAPLVVKFLLLIRSFVLETYANAPI